MQRPRGALYEAVETGDIAAIEAFFEQDSVRAQVEETNAFIAAHASSQPPRAVLSFPSSLPPSPWYHETPHCSRCTSPGLLFNVAIRRRHIAVMEWFFSATRVASMGATLAHVLQDIGMYAMEAQRLDVLELILSSAVFHELLSGDSQQRLLNTLLCSVGRRHCTGARQLLVAHGAQIPYQNNNDDNNNYNSNNVDDTFPAPIVLSMGTTLLATSGVGCLVGDLMGIKTYMLTSEIAHRLGQHSVRGHDVKGSDILWIAASIGKVPTVRKLLERCFIDADVRDGQGPTALISAVAASANVNASKSALPIVELLLEYGADVMLKDDHGRTALHYAVTLEQTAIAEVLLQHGADPNVIDADGATPLDGVPVHLIHEPKHAELLELLLRYGADPFLTGRHGHRSTFDRLIETEEGGAFVAASLQYFRRPVISSCLGRSVKVVLQE